jgi:hypothetical protein
MHITSVVTLKQPKKHQQTAPHYTTAVQAAAMLLPPSNLKGLIFN